MLLSIHMPKQLYKGSNESFNESLRHVRPAFTNSVLLQKISYGHTKLCAIEKNMVIRVHSETVKMR